MAAFSPSVPYLREVEVSITSRCTLACAECGFLVPQQPEPSIGEPVAELATALQVLQSLGVRIGSLAVLGGEPTMNGPLLERALIAFSAVGIAERLEVVTNGLTPRGLTATSLRLIGRLSVSVYGLSEGLLERYRTWLQIVAPHIDLVVRRNEAGWDRWTEPRTVSFDRAQQMFSDCWYRRHCVTVERGRLFLCSRIAKLAHDAEGMPIDAGTTLDAIAGYLCQGSAIASCFTCTPMMGLPTVPAGVQPDNRISRLEPRAIAWLNSAIEAARGGAP